MTAGENPPPLRLAIASLGTIGLAVARRVDQGAVPGMMVSCVTGRDLAKATRAVADFARPPVVVPLAAIAENADVVLECAPAALFETIAGTAIGARCVLVPLSVGVLLERMDLVDRAREGGARILVPTGALIGLDAVKAAAEGQVESVKIVTRKPPRGLRGAPHLIQAGISLEDLSAAKRVFAGSARAAARGFPANVNVAAALSLAGIGPDRTEVEIWADPAVTRNTHRIEVISEVSTFSMTIENVPSAENPATGKITALSAIATLKRLTETLVVGT